MYAKLAGRFSTVPVIAAKRVHKKSGFYLLKRTERVLLRTIDTRYVAECAGQMLSLDMSRMTQYERSLDDVLEFTNVSGKIIRHEASQRFIADVYDIFTLYSV